MRRSMPTQGTEMWEESAGALQVGTRSERIKIG